MFTHCIHDIHTSRPHSLCVYVCEVLRRTGSILVVQELFHERRDVKMHWTTCWGSIECSKSRHSCPRSQMNQVYVVLVSVHLASDYLGLLGNPCTSSKRVFFLLRRPMRDNACLEMVLLYMCQGTAVKEIRPRSDSCCFVLVGDLVRTVSSSTSQAYHKPTSA